MGTDICITIAADTSERSAFHFLRSSSTPAPAPSRNQPRVGGAQLEAPRATETCESTTLSNLNVLSAVASGTGNLNRPPGINTEGLMTRRAWGPLAPTYLLWLRVAQSLPGRPAGQPRRPGWRASGPAGKKARPGSEGKKVQVCGKKGPGLREKSLSSAGKKSQLCGKKLTRQPLSRKPGTSFPHKNLSPVISWIVMTVYHHIPRYIVVYDGISW